MRRDATTLLAGLVAAGLSTGPGAPAGAGAPCRPVARIGGDPSLVRAVVPLLEERGVIVGGESPCGAVDAILAPHEGRVRVTIIEPSGTTVERAADDAAGAATAIESWVRSDVSDPLLAAREPPPPPAQSGDREPPPVAKLAGPAATVDAAGGAAPAVDRRIEVSLAGELGVTGDGAVWRGGRLQACIELGPLCAGGLLRFAYDSKRTGDSADLLTGRSAFELALAAELPVRRGRLVLAPGARAGILSMTAERETLTEGESVDETYGLHVGAGIASSLRLGGAWSLRADLAAGWSPFPRTVLGDDRKMDGQPPLAGQPRVHGWFGLGVAYGGL